MTRGQMEQFVAKNQENAQNCTMTASDRALYGVCLDCLAYINNNGYNSNLFTAGMMTIENLAKQCKRGLITKTEYNLRRTAVEKTYLGLN